MGDRKRDHADGYTAATGAVVALVAAAMLFASLLFSVGFLRLHDRGGFGTWPAAALAGPGAALLLAVGLAAGARWAAGRSAPGAARTQALAAAAAGAVFALLEGRHLGATTGEGAAFHAWRVAAAVHVAAAWVAAAGLAGAATRGLGGLGAWRSLWILLLGVWVCLHVLSR